MFRPTLCCDADIDKIIYPVIVQPKIDGVRALYGNAGFTGRSLKPFKNKKINELFSNPLFSGLDGELVVGSWRQRRLCSYTTSLVNTINGGVFSEHGNIHWFIFDHCLLDRDMVYSDRYRTLQKFFYDIREFELPITLVPSLIIHCKSSLLELEQRTIEDGFEGIILRNPNGLYKHGRVTVRENNFLRLKRFNDAEAIVISIEQTYHNSAVVQTNLLGYKERSVRKENLVPLPMIGCLICKDSSGNEIKVAPGAMTKSDKEYYFNNPSEIINKVIKYKFFNHGIKDKPRFPTFLSIRCEEDL